MDYLRNKYRSEQKTLTGKMIRGQGISVIHFKEGRIKDEWLSNNNLLWMTQLGFTFVPPASEAGK